MGRHRKNEPFGIGPSHLSNSRFSFSAFFTSGGFAARPMDELMWSESVDVGRLVYGSSISRLLRNAGREPDREP
jgi:hypothetical protein